MRDYTIKQKIIAVLINDISSYRISQSTGIAETTINNLRRKKSKIDNITLKNALRLLEVYDKLYYDNEPPSIKKIVESDYE